MNLSSLPKRNIEHSGRFFSVRKSRPAINDGNNLCLLGFSGDDPNFLHRSGWVRDNLGKKAPKIYLVGWLESSVHRWRMLEDRLMPVDLAVLPRGKDWPPDRRHRYATDWFIRALEAGKPYDFSN
jgi:hypothetical protein